MALDTKNISTEFDHESPFEPFTKTALIYAYRTEGCGEPGVDSSEIQIAFQVFQPLAPYQCDFGKHFTAHMLRYFKENEGGSIRVISKAEDLVLPLRDYKVLVLPVPSEVLQEWDLSDLLP